jgi:hypothetical protein
LPSSAMTFCTILRASPGMTSMVISEPPKIAEWIRWDDEIALDN